MSSAAGFVRTDFAPHVGLVEPYHRFSGVLYRGAPWDMSHLDAFAFRCDPELGFDVDVVVLFSCHCFSHSIPWDARPLEAIPLDEIFFDGRETRVLDPSRYALSRRYLPRLVEELGQRTIRVAAADQPNFVTLEALDDEGREQLYAVFFEPKKDSRRRRIVLRVQSAYLLDSLTNRLRNAGKVRFSKLLKATYSGQKIRG